MYSHVNHIQCNNNPAIRCITVADLRGREERAPPPLQAQILSNFMQFSGKYGKIVCWRPPGSWYPLLGALDPPLCKAHFLCSAGDKAKPWQLGARIVLKTIALWNFYCSSSSSINAFTKSTMKLLLLRATYIYVPLSKLCIFNLVFRKLLVQRRKWA